MAEIKFTKNELRAQQKKLSQLKKYLPTLQLKKAMLQAEVLSARIEIEECERNYQKKWDDVEVYASLLSTNIEINPQEMAKVKEVVKRYDNIAGVEVPYFEAIHFHSLDYPLFDTPPWVDQVINGLRDLAEAHAKIVVAKEKKKALE